jgi:hypothetical protein
MNAARILGIAIVAAPLASALLLGLGWLVRRALTRHRNRGNR